MTNNRIREIHEFIDEQHYSLLEEPVRLVDIRARMAAIEEFAGDDLLKRSLVGDIARIARPYYPLPECIALYHRQVDIYHEHIRQGDFDDRYSRHVRVSSVYALCERWMMRQYRYPYGDVRRLRPFMQDVLEEAAGWPLRPHPEYLDSLQRWYDELAPGGPLYPSADHLAYVERFEAFAEEIVWDSRDRDYITISNFPAPPKVWPPTHWSCTQHVLEDT